MNKLFLVIDQNYHLYELLKEVKFDLQYQLTLSDNNIQDIINKITHDKNEYLVITKNKKNRLYKNRVIFLDKPIKIYQLHERINLFFSKNKFSSSSSISIGNYILDLNSRIISSNNISLKLTEKEIELIMYLFDSKIEKKSIDIRKDVWGHSEGVETHTVETHIYRLRKKIVDKFNDENFLSYNNGYKLL